MDLSFSGDAWEFNWTRIRASDGALVLGPPVGENLASRGFLKVFLFEEEGNSVKDYVSGSGCQLNGNYEWQYDISGKPFLVLRNGSFAFQPGATVLELFLSIAINIPNLPTANMTLLSDSANTLGIVLKPDGTLSFSIGGAQASSDRKIPKGWFTLTLMTRISQYGPGVAAAFINADQILKLEQQSMRPLFPSNAIVTVGGEFWIRTLVLANTLNVAGGEVVPNTSGYWVSKTFDLGTKKQVVTVTVDAFVGGADSGRLILEMSDDPSFFLTRKAEIKLENGLRTYVVPPVWGQWLKARIELASPWGSIAVKKVSLSMSDFPFVSMSLEPPSFTEGKPLEVKLQPEEITRESMKFRAGNNPILILREYGAPSEADSKKPLRSTIFDEDFYLNFTGGKDYSIPQSGLLDIRGKVYIQGNETHLLDCVGHLKLFIDGSPILDIQRSDHASVDPVSAELRLPSGWYDFRLLLGSPSQKPKLYWARLTPQGPKVLSRAEVLGPFEFLPARIATSLNPPPFTLWDDSMLEFGVEGKLFDYYVELTKGANTFGVNSAATFVSPFSVSPPLRKIGEIRDLGNVTWPILSSGRTIYISLTNAILALEGLKPVWYRATSKITGAPVLANGRIYVPTESGILELHSESGKEIRRITRTNAYPVSILYFLDRLYVGWSDHKIEIYSPSGIQLGGISLEQGATHLDIPHGDSPYYRSPHLDVPHVYVPHIDVDTTDHEDVWGYSRARLRWDPVSQQFIIEYVQIDHIDRTEHQRVYQDHQDIPHEDVSHGDTSHHDTPPHLDQVLTPDDIENLLSLSPFARGSNPTERGLNHEILVVRPTGVFLLSESLQTKFSIAPIHGPITFASLNDEAGNYPFTRIIAVGEMRGKLSFYSAHDGAKLSEVTLENPVRWVIPLKAGFLVAHGGTLSLVHPFEGLVYFSLEVEEEIRGLPLVDRDGNLYLITERSLMVFSPSFELIQKISFEEEVVSFAITKEGVACLVTESGVHLFQGGSTSPSLDLLIWPGQPRAQENCWLIADAYDVNPIERILWETGGRPQEGWMITVTFPEPGEKTIYLAARSGGKESAFIRRIIRVLPPWASPTTRALVCADLTQEVTILKDMRVPPLGLEEIYRDSNLIVRVDTRGESLSNTTVKIIFKREESETAQVLLEKTFTVLDGTLGIAETTLTPSDLKTLSPGKYFWAITATRDGSTWTISRGYSVLREGMA
jgi:hypothetical protein